MHSFLPISVVGPREAGKSHFIAVLIEQIKRQAGDFNWSFRALNDETMRLYDKRFYKPLYKEKYAINQTQTADRDAHAPLVYSLNQGGAATNVIFYDSAGERFDSEEQMETRYLSHSRGIVFLIDPLQIPNVRKFLKKLNPDFKRVAPGVHTPVGQIFQRTINVLRKEFPIGKIPIPLAVVFTKIDAIREYVTDDAPFYVPSFHRGGFSISDGRRVGEYARRLATLDDDVIPNAQNFANVAFFGVSALGRSPKVAQSDDDSQNAGKLWFTPRPIRILDPFLWLLYNWNFLAAIK